MYSSNKICRDNAAKTTRSHVLFLLDDNYCFLFFILSRKASVKLAQE